ncbi:alkaline phosphatase D family protein [Litoribrevibacter euphylliae]|uniref:Alkaline phosphatase D family protein n=1 Tax=Litoribrevibacter euphylliae TaxID=1834034 RepID=A0ABV7HDG3_9GAMM
MGLKTNISRRRFIKTAVAASGAAALPLSGLTGCSNSDSNSSSSAPNYFPQSLMSGDPRENSVILWTRVNDSSASGDITLALEVATASDFNEASLVLAQEFAAEADHDHCLKVRVINLDAATQYYYRFTYVKNGKANRTNTGRTKTAPEAGSDTDLKFAYVSCQDYNGRYYNTYLPLLEEDLDFVVHMGDYIYETTGASFQSSEGRSIQFDDLDGAINLGDDGYAAQSLSNYRQLYKEYRSDSVLQQLHERFPLIAIWDDHEYSDDSWKNNGTYFDAGKSEASTFRKHNSEQAWFEFMPIDHEAAIDDTALNAGGALDVTEDQLYPNTRIYRDFQFGANLSLFLTDFRTNRPDHIIAEDAFPGALAMTQAQIIATLDVTTGGNGAATHAALFGSNTFAYINIDDAAYSTTRAYLRLIMGSQYRDTFEARGISAEDAGKNYAQLANEAVTGNLSAFYINAALTTARDSGALAVPDSAFISDADMTAAEKGIAFVHFGKQGLISDLGSRYFVNKDLFDLYAGFLAAADGGASQNAYGDTQNTWLGTQLATNGGTWNVMGSSVSFSPLLLDLRNSAANPNFTTLNALSAFDAIPSLLQSRFYLNADHWDGFPNAKQNLINNVFAGSNVISIAGDIHSTYVTDHGNGSFDITTSSATSGTFGSYLDEAATGLIEGLGGSAEDLAPLMAALDQLLPNATSAADVASTLSFARLREHGVAIVDVTADNFQVTMHNVPTSENGNEYISESWYERSADFIANLRTHVINIDEATRTLNVTPAS